MGWLNNFFTNITVTNNIAYSNGFISNGDGTYTSTPGIFLYSGTPAVGNLVYSSTGSNRGHDKFGNNYLNGDTEYDNSNLIAVGFSTQGTQTGVSYWTFTAQPNATFTQGAGIFPSLLSAGGLEMDVGGNPLTGTGGFNLVNDSSFAGSSFNIDANSNPLVWTNGGNLSPSTGDNQRYNIGHQIQQLGPIAVNSTTFTTFAGFTIGNAANGNYHLRFIADYQGAQAAGSPAFQLSSIGIFTTNRQFWRFVTPGNPSSEAARFATATGTAIIGPTLLSGGSQWVEADIYLSMSTAADIHIQAATQTAGDNFTIQRAFLEVEHW